MNKWFPMWRIRQQSWKLLRAIYSLDHSGSKMFSLTSPEIKALHLPNAQEALDYLSSKHFVKFLKKLSNGLSPFSLTDEGISYLPDESARRWHTVWHDFGLPIVLCILTTLTTLWITGYFQRAPSVPAATSQPSPSVPSSQSTPKPE